MMKFEVEGHLGVEAAATLLTFRHPVHKYEVHIENLNMSPGTERPLLTMFVVFDADSLVAAASVGPSHLDRFLQFLSFATGARFGSARRQCLYDWSSTEQSMREGYEYRRFPDANVPQMIMNHLVVSTVEALWHSDDANADVMQALDWFSAGVSASRIADQFQLFWFCVETLARSSRDKTPVPDRCPKCRAELFCRTCDRVSMHRPYPTQAIEQLFRRFIRGDADRLFKAATRMRHALMHGDLLTGAEQEEGATLSQVVDDLGRLAWVSLLDALVRTSRKTGDVRLHPIQPSSFLHQSEEFVVHVAVGFALGRQPTFDDLPTLDVARQIHEREDGGSEVS